MVIVTDLQYGLEKRLVKKIDLMIDRCEQKNPKRDAVLICEGSEGEGKTNSSVAISYYIKSKTQRDIHIFFRLEGLIKFAQENKGKIIIWDEPALDSLGSDWYKRVNKDLIRLLMTVRKNRHFFIFNFTRFYRFSEYIIVDRGLGLVHMYSRNEIQPGRFVYIKRRDLEALYTTYKKSKKRIYKSLTSFRGNFPEVMEKHFDKMDICVEGKVHATLADYEKQKDLGIMSIGEKKKEVNKEKEELAKLKVRIASINLKMTNRKQLADQLGISERTLNRWKENVTNRAIS